MNSKGGSWNFARFREVDLRIHFSLPLLALYVFFVTTLRLDTIVKQGLVGQSPLAWPAWVFGGLFSAGLIFSVLLHELGHVRVALKQGIRVRSITLMMLGGVSEMDRIPDTRFAELRLAVAGPLVSLGLGGFFLLLSKIIPEPQFPDLKLFILWMGTANLTLGVFNLLPAFPLDGGRALRSMLAAKKGIIPATQTAVRLGTFFSAVLGLLGLFTFNVFLLLIAFFLYGAAQAELFQIISSAALRGMKVKDLTVETPFLTTEETLLDATEKMVTTGFTHLPVKPTPDLPESTASTINIEQIRRVPRDFRHLTFVKDVIPPAGPLLHPEDLLSEKVSELTQQPSGVLPVQITPERFGILRLSDVTRTLQLESIGGTAERRKEEESPKAA